MAVRRQTKRALRFRDLMPYRIAEVLLVMDAALSAIRFSWRR